MARLFVCWFSLVLCAGCADLRLRPYRDDRCLADYRYALGEQRLDIGDLQVCYQELGRGRTVLILPGLGTNIDFWQLNAPVLAERYHVLLVDLPGLGKSAKPDAPYDLLWMCAQIIAFLDAKGVDETSVIGGSLGGHLGLLLALHYPQRIEKLVLMGSPGAWEPPGPALRLAFLLFWHDALVTDYVRWRWPFLYQHMFRRQTPMTQAILRYQMAARAGGGYFAPEGRAMSRCLRSIFDNSCRDRLGAVDCPVLLVWGEYDEIHPRATAEYLRLHLPDSRLVVIPDAGHEAMVDQPEAFNRAVLSFLDGGTAAVADGQ